jgi:very-short-patch-repair endonuclease
VELDGQAYHPWQDIGRDNSLAVDGIQVLRYGWADVVGRACAVAIQIGEVAAKRGWTGALRRCGPSCEVRRP